MPSNKNLNLAQLSRISSLMVYLKSKPYRTKQNILDYFETIDKGFNERTFYRLIKTLSIDFGIEIIFDYTNNGYFFDEDNSSNPDSFLSLLEMLTTTELFSTDFQENNYALSFIEFENKAAIQSIPNFKTILNAIRQQLPISFSHTSFYYLNKKETYNLKPYFLKQYQNRWYVVGETEKGYRTFGIDRIENIEIGLKKFKPKTEEAKDKFNHVIGLNYTDNRIQKVRLQFHSSQKPYLVSLPLHHSQKEIVSTNDEVFEIELLIQPNFEFNQQILKFGSLVKVLEPKWLVDEIRDELKKAVENYK